MFESYKSTQMEQQRDRYNFSGLRLGLFPRRKGRFELQNSCKIHQQENIFQ